MARRAKKLKMFDKETTGITSLELEPAYTKLRPLFLIALAKLARQGFVVDPTESLDLVHDFFVEEWAKVRRNYQEAKGTFEGYVFGAFVHFARPRIVRRQKLQSLRVDPEILNAMPAKDLDPYEEWEPEHEPAMVRAAMRKLPPLQRDALFRYVARPVPSERAIATKLGLSRYGLRENLIEALGHVTVLLDKPQGIPDRDWQIALAVWRDERTIDQTAKYVGVTPTQVRRAQERNRHFLATALSHYKPLKASNSRRAIMKPHRNLIHADTLLEQVLKSPGNQELLSQVRDNATDVLAAMENLQSFGLSEADWSGLETTWLATVYQTIAESLGYEEPEESRLSQSLSAARQEEEKSIGQAFKEVFLPSLRPSLRPGFEEWNRLFQKVSEVDREVQQELLREPSVRASLPDSKPLLAYGVTPLGIFRATEAVSSLLRRLVRYEMLSRDAAILLEPQRVETSDGSGEALDRSLVVDEIGNVTEWRSELNEAFWPWLVKSAGYVPLIFNGFYAEPKGEGVRLTRTEETYEDLMVRWKVDSVAAGATYS